MFARGNKAPTVDDAQKVIDDLLRKIGKLQVTRTQRPQNAPIDQLRRAVRVRCCCAARVLMNGSHWSV